MEAALNQEKMIFTTFSDEEISFALKGACDAVESRFMQFANQFELDDGTTLCAILLMNESIYCANIGDSRALCGGWRGTIPLSTDHKAETNQKYVEAVGGFVHPLLTKTNSFLVVSGPDRVFPGGLAVSRSIGDRNFKNEVKLQ